MEKYETNILKKTVTLQNSAIKLRSIKKYTEALNIIHQAITIDHNNPDLHNTAGIILFDLNKFDQAITSFTKAISLRSKFIEALYNLANTYSALKKYQEAIDTYLKVLNINPNFKDALTNLGNVYNNQGNPDKAANCFLAVVNLDKNNSRAFLNLANTYIQMENYRKAQFLLFKAISIDGNYAEAYNNLAICYERLEFYPKAIDALKISLSIDGKNSISIMNLGANLLKINRITEAKECFNKALSLAPDLPEVHVNIAELEFQQGNINRAIESANLASKLSPTHSTSREAIIKYHIFNDDILTARQFAESAMGPNYKFDSITCLMNLVVILYLNDHLKVAGGLLYANQIYFTKTEKKNEAEMAYINFISHLLVWKDANSTPRLIADKSSYLYVLGDSHSLSWHNVNIKYDCVRTCISKWIPGIKAWHLGNKSYNQYKYKFEKVVSGLPKSSIVLVSAGEIDCRFNEGIFKLISRNKSEDIFIIIKNTIDGYLNYLKQIQLRYDVQFIIQGVPATHVHDRNTLTEDQESHARMIKLYNEQLLILSQVGGFTIIDLFQLTADPACLSNETWHLDKIHLIPTAIYEAFDKYLVYPDNYNSVAGDA